MKDVNKVILVGRLGADPILKNTQTGKVVVRFSLATSRRVRKESPSGEVNYEEQTEWHKIVAWERLGETCHQYLRKGGGAYVEGEIRTRKFEDSSGQERTAFEVVADDVCFLAQPTKSTPEAAVA